MGRLQETVSMKGIITAFAEATIQFITNYKFNGSISFVITDNKEAKAINSTLKLLQWVKYNNEKLSVCLVGESTCPDYLGGIAQNGMV